MLRACTQDYSGTVVLIRVEAGILLARIEAVMLADDEELDLFADKQMIMIPERTGSQDGESSGHISELLKVVAPDGEDKPMWYPFMKFVVEAMKSALKAKGIK